MRKFQLWGVLVLLALFLAGTQTVRSGEPSLSINRGENSTNTRFVTLWFVPSVTPQYVRISNNADMSGSNWESFFSQKNWTLTSGPGTKTLYAQFRDKSGYDSPIVSDSIELKLPAKTTLTFTINNKATETNSRYVDVVLTYSDGVETIALGNSADSFEVPIRIQKNVNWILTPGTGDKTVFIKYSDAFGNSKVVSQKIRYVQPGRYLKEGTLLKGQSDTLYYYGYDGRLHAFLHNALFHSWFKDFLDVNVVSQVKLHEYQVGTPVCLRSGTWLLRFTNSSRVYAVEPGCFLRPLRSEAEAYVLFGKDWQKRIMTMDAFYEIFYRVRSQTVYTQREDRDQDGLDKKQEEMYGSSDYKVDSDADGLSDYEEIIYWFSDPVLADTDGDATVDGKEILNNQSPVGYRELRTVPEHTYEYPIGSVVYDPDTKTNFFRNTDGQYYNYNKLKKSKEDDIVLPFADNFIIRPTILVPITKAKATLKTDPAFLRHPVTGDGSYFIAQ